MGEVRVFSLSLYPETEATVFDYWVKNTVINIISGFLLTDTDVIFYVCDSEDQKEEQRHRVFEYWYEKATEFHGFIGKFNYAIESSNGYKVYSSILYNKENYLAEFIIKQFKDEIDIY